MFHETEKKLRIIFTGLKCQKKSVNLHFQLNKYMDYV